jgi:anti-anti-sigma factor
MTVTSTSDGPVTTLVIDGTIDTRAAPDFEAALTQAIDAGARGIVVDFQRVDLITSAGIRVLVLFTKRLSAVGGGLALCAVTPDVKRVFEIAGLASQLKMCDTRAAAVSALPRPASATAAPQGSRVTRLVGALLGGRGDAATTPRKGAASRVAQDVADLLSDTKRSGQ